MLLPRIVFGSAYADMRLAPYIFIIALIAHPHPGSRGPAFLAGASPWPALPSSLLRTGGTTVSTFLYDRSYDRELAALDHVPRGARMVTFVGRPCEEQWAMSRRLHLPAMAIVRRDAFSNDQWTMAGAQLLQVRYRAGLAVYPRPDPGGDRAALPPRGLADARHLARHLSARRASTMSGSSIRRTMIRALTAGLIEVWRDGRSVLYRVDRSQPPELQEAR